MKIATWNVNGIRARYDQLQEWVARDQPDVVCLQEIKAAPAQIPPLLANLDGYWCHWHGTGGYSGVALHVNCRTVVERPAIVPPAFDFETRIVHVRLASPSAPPEPSENRQGTPREPPGNLPEPPENLQVPPDLVIASVYVPNGGKDYGAKIRFLETLIDWAGEVQADGTRLVICGDLNVAREERDVHPKERKPGATGQRPEERMLLERLLATGLVDVGRALDPDNDGLFTWWAPWRNMRQRNIGWRLDYVLASAPLAATATACPVLKEIGTSDHAPVMATF